MNMDSPHMYDSAEYKKGGVQNPKVKISNGVFQDVSEFSELSDLNNSEISLDLQNIIEDNSHHHNLVSDNLIQDLQSLNVDKSNLTNLGGPHCPRGLGASPNIGSMAAHLANNGGAMYNTLAYLPQPVHGGSQFDRGYLERPPIKEEPHEQEFPQEYMPCARINYGGYGAEALAHYPMTPTTVPGVDALLKSPMKSPVIPNKGGGKGPKLDLKCNDEYRRRRERNNIAVRKSREKAKARSRETEERVKALNDENKKLHEKCKFLLEKLSMYHSVFSSMDFQCIPEPYRTDFRNRMEGLNVQHSHQILGL